MELNSKNFDKEINCEKILIDFWASWCGPCRMLSPIVDDVSEIIKIGKVNVDENNELANKFNIMSIPCLVLFKNGKEVKRTVGLINKEELLEFIKD